MSDYDLGYEQYLDFLTHSYMEEQVLQKHIEEAKKKGEY